MITGYVASAWQSEFHSLDHDEAFGAGSAGPGKTMCLTAEPFEQIRVEHERCKLPKDHPYYHPWGSSVGRALHVRRTMPMLDETIGLSKHLIPGMDPGAKWNQQSHTWQLSSGYEYRFGHCAERDDWMQYQGKQFTILCLDELPQFEEYQYNQLKSRVRTSDPVLIHMLKIRAMGNPLVRRESGVDFAVFDPWWVRRYFVDPAPEGRKTIKTEITMDDGTKKWWRRIYLPAKLKDNPDPAFRERYEFSLRHLPRHVQAALLEGDWYSVAGAHYSADFHRDRHICAPFNVPNDWVWVRALDWGYKKPGVVYWAAEDPDGTLFVVKELTFQYTLAPDVAKRIREWELNKGLWNRSERHSRITGPADTQIWEERGQSGLTMVEEFRKVGVGWQPADKKSRAKNSQRLLGRLRASAGDLRTKPGIVFFSNCVEIIKNLPAIPSDPSDPESPLKGPGGGHHHEAILYLAAYVSRDREGPKLDDDDWEEEDHKFAATDWGQYGYGGD